MTATKNRAGMFCRPHLSGYRPGPRRLSVANWRPACPWDSFLLLEVQCQRLYSTTFANRVNLVREVPQGANRGLRLSSLGPLACSNSGERVPSSGLRTGTRVYIRSRRRGPTPSRPSPRTRPPGSRGCSTTSSTTNTTTPTGTHTTPFARARRKPFDRGCGPRPTGRPLPSSPP